jgi:hypothetical protein
LGSKCFYQTLVSLINWPGPVALGLSAWLGNSLFFDRSLRDKWPQFTLTLTWGGFTWICGVRPHPDRQSDQTLIGLRIGS